MTEETKRPSLTICVLAKENICALTTMCFMNLTTDKDLTSAVYLQPQLSIGQSSITKARSENVTSWYKTAKSGDLFMFLDSDQTFVSGDILRSLYYIKSADVVCGSYSRKNGTMTVQPKNVVSFYKNREGELWYGSTGFMMFTWDIVHKIISSIGGPIPTSLTSEAYALFLERVVSEPEINRKDLWLSEDYSFCWLVRQNGGKIMGYISPTIGHIIPQDKYVVIPTSTEWPENSIVVYCGKTSEAWSPKNLSSGIGGSELAVIKLTPYWVRKGYSVTVFCHCDKPGTYDGVIYKNWDEFNLLDQFDTLVVWRSTEFLTYADIKAKRCVLDLHDLVVPEQITDRLLSVTDKIFVKSNYHKKLLGEKTPQEKICVIPNGGYVTPRSSESKKTPKKDPNYIIYSSSYDRGLAYMLKWGWPKIKQACPNAYLKIFYGWNGFDASQPKTMETQLYKRIISEMMEQPGVTECGRISQQELLKEKSKANVHWYTGDFQEIDCISVRESASVGCIPVVSEQVEVFREKSYCPIRISGDPRTKEMQEESAQEIIRLLSDREYAEKIRSSLVVSAEETWEKVAEKWLKEITGQNCM